MKELLKIERIDHVTKITNNSGYDLLISWKPIFPKRKYRSFYLVAKDCYVIIEWELDLSTISITFQNPNPCRVDVIGNPKIRTYSEKE